MTLMTPKSAETRDLDADLAICEAALSAPWIADGYEVRFKPEGKVSSFIGNFVHQDEARFTAEARQGWPYAIRRAMAAEAEVDRLRNELDILQEQLRQHHRSASPSGCYD